MMLRPPWASDATWQWALEMQQRDLEEDKQKERAKQANALFIAQESFNKYCWKKAKKDAS